MKNVWWKEAVVYQVYPRSFKDSNGDGIGDLRGIIEKLDYIHDLGIDIIWLSPIYKSPNADNGYDISDYYDIMDEFGTMADFDELLAKAHQKKLKIVMDLVVNHTSDEHPWFIESRKSKDNPYRGYYIWRDGKDGHEPNNWVSAFGGSAWQLDAATGQYYLHIYADKQPDLNWENEEMRKDIHKMINWWLKKGIDGFRMDVINCISKNQDFPDDLLPLNGQRRIGSRYYLNGPRIHEFLQEMNRETVSKYDVMTVGEGPRITSDIAGLYVNEDRKELNMIFHFEHMDMHRTPGNKLLARPWKLTMLKKIFWDWHNALKKNGWNSIYMNNHDQPRMVSRFGNDQAYRIESAKMLATLLLTWPGTPYIYQGEEIGITNVNFESIKDYRDIETLNYYEEKLSKGENPWDIMSRIHTSSRDNARTPMQWDESENAGFTDGTPWMNLNPNFTEINVKKALEDQNSIYYYYKELIALRKKYEVFVYGDCELLYPDDENIFAYVRTLERQKFLILLNFFQNDVEFKMPADIPWAGAKILIGNYNVKNSLQPSMHLKTYEACIYQLNY